MIVDARITFGGKISRKVFEGLLETMKKDHFYDLSVNISKSQYENFSFAGECEDGSFEYTEEYCQDNNISFDIHTGFNEEGFAEKSQFRPGMEIKTFFINNIISGGK